MIFAAILSIAIGVQADPLIFSFGEWHGRCFREGHLDGMDHELCQADIFVDTGARLERSAEGLSVRPFPGECDPDVRTGHLSSSALARGDRAARVAAFVRAQIAAALQVCHVKRPIPQIREADIAAILRASDGLKPGSFVQLDPAVRAPEAKQCGEQLERAWRAGLRAHPPAAGESVKVMMYTFSKGGPARAEKRFALLPGMMENFVALGMGPGGAVMSASKSADAWRNPPSEWFLTTCDVAIEAWSSFVELGLFTTPSSGTPIFVVRAPTGVAGDRGFVITQQPLTQEAH